METMTDTAVASDRRPWIVAAVLGAIAVALVVVLLAAILPQRHHDRSRPVVNGAITATEQRAMDAASQEVANLLTYARKTFDADYARTLAGATGPLASDLTKNKATLLSQMKTGKFDLQGTVTGTAFEQQSGATALILVSAQGYKLPDGAQKTLSSTARFELTMNEVNGKWLASDLQSVGLV
jgi:Mce-associated membrane protein